MASTRSTPAAQRDRERQADAKVKTEKAEADHKAAVAELERLLVDWTAPRFPDGWIVLFHAAACWFKYSVRTSCGVR